MDVLFYLLIALAVLAIIWWAITQMGLPQPARIVASVVLALVAIVLLLRLAPAGLHLTGG